MRFLWAFMLLFGLCSANMPNKAPVVSDTTHSLSKIKKKVAYTELKTALETQKGRKLNFKEKLATKILVKKLNKNISPEKKKNRPIHWTSVFALILGIIGFFFGFPFLFTIIFGIIGITKSDSKTGQALSIIGMILNVIGLLLIFVCGGLWIACFFM
ncbi:MAG: hypothetical protein MUC49_04785 [Raineya sp.]|jgi:hypothetical protein|nr:hypothetical protein [Raineya sp.]